MGLIEVAERFMDVCLMTECLMHFVFALLKNKYLWVDVNFRRIISAGVTSNYGMDFVTDYQIYACLPLFSSFWVKV